MQEKTCCFIGHRTIDATEALKRKLTETIEKLITEEKVDTFLFGSKSEFNTLCLELVTALKEKYPDIKRIYIRAEYPVIDENYKAYLLKFYEETYFPEKMIGAGKAVYIERNLEMIERSRFCVFYYNGNKIQENRKSGTKIALDYAEKQNKKVLLFN
ncbi:MAG: DUF1273 family protein [Clostridia bacterium]|nr:DUF1273 family protein [Clostridia bacterium]